VASVARYPITPGSATIARAARPVEMCVRLIPGLLSSPDVLHGIGSAALYAPIAELRR
jgi:hypothetical protein